MKYRGVLKSFLCSILSLLLIFTLVGCSFNFDDVKEKGSEIWEDVKDKGKAALSGAEDIFGKAKDKIVESYGTTKDGAIWLYNEAADWTVEGYNKASAKATELIGDAKEYISGLTTPKTYEIQYAQTNPGYPIKDLSAGTSFNLSDAIVIDNNYLTEQFVAYYISSVLGARGYTVLNGAAYYKDNVYGGLIFTKGDTFIEENGTKICSCGFIQLVPENYSGLKITDKMVQTGLIAVSTNSYGESAQSFIVDEYATIDSFSGIFNNVYFKYTQSDHYVVSISLKANKEINYDSKVELYDFDNDKVVYSSEDAEREVKELYVNNRECFDGAVSNVNAIVDVEENTDGDLSSVFLLDGKTLDKLSDTASGGSSKVADFISSGLKTGLFSKIKSINGNQFLTVDSDGKSHVLGSENAMDSGRVTNGLISTIGSGLATAGAVASVVCVCKAGVVAVSAIVITTGTASIIYNVSNMIAGCQDVYYGAKGDISESQNPVLAVFKSLIPDEKTATLVYHIWGAANTLVSNIMMPVSKALNIAKVKGLNAFQTAGNVIRASVTTVAKALASGIGAGIVANYVSKVVTRVSNDENLGKLVGFGACLVSGMLIYKGLDSIDKKLDISGLYPKADVKSAFYKNKEEQTKQLYKENVSRKQRGEDEELVKALTDIAADQYGIEEKPTVRIVYSNNTADCGSYNCSDNTLTVNIRASEHMTLEGLADTVGHEMRHAWQYQDAIYNGNVEMYDSLANYISPNSDGSNYTAYTSQLCEADAWEAGSRFSQFILGLIG